MNMEPGNNSVGDTRAWNLTIDQAAHYHRRLATMYAARSKRLADKATRGARAAQCLAVGVALWAILWTALWVAGRLS